MILPRSKDSIFLYIIVHTCLLIKKYSALQDNSYFFLNRRLKMEEKMHSSLYLTTLKKSIVLVNITSQTNKYNVQPWSILYLLQNQAHFSEMYLHFITKKMT